MVELNRRFVEGYVHFQHEPRVQRLRESVLKYNRRVRDLGLRDHQVILVPCCSEGGYLNPDIILITGPKGQQSGLEDPGPTPLSNGVAHGLDRARASGGSAQWPYLSISVRDLPKKSKRHAHKSPPLKHKLLITYLSNLEALAASSVKIAGRDVLATWKVLISLGVAPFLYAFYAVLATIVAVKAHAPLRWRLWTPFIVIAALPCIGFAALKFGEAGMDVLK